MKLNYLVKLGLLLILVVEISIGLRISRKSKSKELDDLSLEDKLDSNSKVSRNYINYSIDGPNMIGLKRGLIEEMTPERVGYDFH